LVRTTLDAARAPSLNRHTHKADTPVDDPRTLLMRWTSQCYKYIKERTPALDPKQWFLKTTWDMASCNRHLESSACSWKASGHLKDIRRHLEASGRHPGRMWKHLDASTNHLETSGGIWEASGDIWTHVEASGAN